MRTVLAIARKDLLLLWRDKAGLFFVLLFPLVYGLFFGAIFSGQGGGASKLRIAVVDQDGTPAARAFRDRLAASAALEVEDLALAAAADAVRKGRKVAYVLLPEGFGAASPLSGQGPAPQLGIDPSRQAESGLLQGLVTESWFSAALGDTTGFASARPQIAPVQREARRPGSSFDISFPSAILWGVLGCAAGFAITLVRERAQGTLLRLQVAPISRTHVLAGKALACFLACCAVIALLIVFAAAALGLRVNDPLAMLLATVCTALCFTGIMMLVSVLGRTEQAVGGAGWAIFVVMAMLGGGMVPLIAMPSWMLTASGVSPVKWGILALEGAGWRGFSLGELALPCAVLIGVGAVAFALGALRLRASAAHS
jgi:ABC-2 type transport system permease protein